MTVCVYQISRNLIHAIWWVSRLCLGVIISDIYQYGIVLTLCAEMNHVVCVTAFVTNFLFFFLSIWGHQMETLSVLVALCVCVCRGGGGGVTGHRWIPLTKASEVVLWCLFWSAPEQTAAKFGWFFFWFPGTNWGTIAKVGLGIGVGALGAVALAPVAVAAAGFGARGIASGSLAASMMSASAAASGGGVAAGSAVAVLQSIGAAGLGATGTAVVGGAGATIGGAAAAAAAASQMGNSSQNEAQGEDQNEDDVLHEGQRTSRATQTDNNSSWPNGNNDSRASLLYKPVCHSQTSGEPIWKYALCYITAWISDNHHSFPRGANTHPIP